MKKSETKFREKVCKFLDSLDNCYHESIQQVAIRGTADKIVVCHGWGIWAELKDEVGTPDPLQLYKMSAWQNKGKGIAFIWRPQNHNEVMRFLSLLDAGIFDRRLLAEVHKKENI